MCPSQRCGDRREIFQLKDFEKLKIDLEEQCGWAEY